MGDVSKVYSPNELEGLSESDKRELQGELDKQVRTSREIRAIILAHDELNASLKDKLRDTYNRLIKSK